MSRKPARRADMATNDKQKTSISDDARPALTDGNAMNVAASSHPKSKAWLDCSRALSPFTLSLFENGDEEETTVVNDKEPPLVPEKLNEVNDGAPTLKKARRTSMTIAGPTVDPKLIFSEIVSRFGPAPSLPTAAAATTTRHDSRFDSTGSDVNEAPFRPRVFADMTMNTRRLSDSDVRAIFESVHHQRPPPPNLQFRVVPVGPGGMRLSPPSYEFEDGLYILMKPQKKNVRPKQQPKVPPHLKGHVMREKPPASCPWSLSGPQFPQSTDIQQRYCYPKGDPEYSSRKGGALWTMYSSDGKENLEYRLLHVYFSAKRAINKGAASVKLKKRSHLPESRPRSTPTLPAATAPAPLTHSVDGSRQDPFAMDCRPSSINKEAFNAMLENLSPLAVDYHRRSLPAAAVPAPTHNVDGSRDEPHAMQSRPSSVNKEATDATVENLSPQGQESTQELGDSSRADIVLAPQVKPLCQHQGATTRRLSDSDVRAIFESIHHQRPPPPNLQFRVVPVGPGGMRLSPPSYEFEDGLYILMKPQKKNVRPKQQPKVPPHLKGHVMREKPPASCPWSLSGPQFSQPTAIQQRYCYPKGDPEYSSRKGGALWTMYSSDGKENLEYRLLHVYFSAKRAINKGAASVKLKKRSHLPESRPRSTPTLPGTAHSPTHIVVDGSRQDPYAMDCRPSSAPTLRTTRPHGLTYQTTGSRPDLASQEAFSHHFFNLATEAVQANVSGSNHNTGQSDPALFPGLVDSCSTSVLEEDFVTLTTTKAPISAVEEGQAMQMSPPKHYQQLQTQSNEEASYGWAPSQPPSNEEFAWSYGWAPSHPPEHHSQQIQAQSNKEAGWSFGWAPSQPPEYYSQQLQAQSWSYGWAPSQPPEHHSQQPQLHSNKETTWSYGWAPSQPPAHDSQQPQLHSNEEAAWSGWAPSQPPAHDSQQLRAQSNEGFAWSYGWAPSQPPAHDSQQPQLHSNKEAAWSYGWAPSQPPNHASGAYDGSLPHEYGPDNYLANQAALGRAAPAATSKDDDEAYTPTDVEASSDSDDDETSSNYSDEF